jgi:GNAT superfamily N-acetyltransferase
MSEITTYYLEMASPDALTEKPDAGGLTVSECEIPQFQVNRFMYRFVGESWQWTERLSWSDQQWQAYVNDDKLRTWVAYCQGSLAGYYELQSQAGGDVEIAYFGLAESFIGRGFGGYLLYHAIQSAWDWGDTGRVWVHTCSLDHPGALGNYRARGMSLYRTETESNQT